MMEEILYWVAYCLSTFLEFYIISKFMKMFLGEGNRGKSCYYSSLYSQICRMYSSIYLFSTWNDKYVMWGNNLVYCSLWIWWKSC